MSTVRGKYPRNFPGRALVFAVVAAVGFYVGACITVERVSNGFDLPPVLIQAPR